MPEFRLYKSPAKAIKLLLGCAAFVALGVLLLRAPDAPAWVAWSSIGFFGLGTPVSIFQLLDRRPQIIINEVGIFDCTAHRDFINWEIIQDAYLAEAHRQVLICLLVDEAFKSSRKKGQFGRRMAALNKELGFQELNISLSYVSVDPERLAGFILAMRSASMPERTSLVKQAIANL
ncbi:MAG: STM3941 family protein [Janthinobacterium lividum]